MAKDNYRDSDSGRYIRKEDAERRPKETWEKERRKPAPKPSPKKGK